MLVSPLRSGLVNRERLMCLDAKELKSRHIKVKSIKKKPFFLWFNEKSPKIVLCTSKAITARPSRISNRKSDTKMWIKKSIGAFQTRTWAMSAPMTVMWSTKYRCQCPSFATHQAIIHYGTYINGKLDQLKIWLFARDSYWLTLRKVGPSMSITY